MAKSVHDHCIAKGLSLEKLSTLSNLDLERVQAIYLGRWTPSPAERKLIADVLEVEVADIAWGHKTPIQHIYGMGPD